MLIEFLFKSSATSANVPLPAKQSNIQSFSFVKTLTRCVIIFLGLAVFYVLAIGFNRPWSWYAGISGPAVLVGILFLLSWFKKRS